jgi:RNA polymerase sigma-70 factor (ECF subfamily)
MAIGDLVRRARAGDSEAFEELVRLHLRAAYTIALGVTNDPTDAEDVVQDAFIAALEKIDGCEDPDRFSGWLLAIVRNRALNLRRSQVVRAVAPLDALKATTSSDSPERDTARSLFRDELTHAMGELTEVQRQVVLLHDLEGYKHREIGDLLGISDGASRFHLSTARALLRAKLNGNAREEL